MENVSYELVAEWESERAMVKVWKPMLAPEEYALRFRILKSAAQAISKELYWPKEKVST